MKTYTLNNNSLHIVLACDLRGSIVGRLLVRHIIDGNITPFGSELLSHERAQPSMSRCIN